MANSKYQYIKLTDRAHYNNVVRCQGRIQYEYDREKEEWVRSGILLEYLCDESPLYECYEEISEEEALKIIKG